MQFAQIGVYFDVWVFFGRMSLRQLYERRINQPMTDFLGKITLRDSGGDLTSKNYHLQATSYNDAETDLNSIKDALAETTEAVVARVTITAVLEESSDYAPAGVQVEERASVTCSLTDKDQKYAMDIPAPRSELFIAGQGESSNIVNIAGAELQTYIGAVASLSFVSDGDTVANVLFGKRTHRASRRG